MSLHDLPSLRESAKLPVSTLDHSAMHDEITSHWQRRRIPLIIFIGVFLCVGLGIWIAMNSMRPYAHIIDLYMITQQLIDPNATAPDTQDAESSDNNPTDTSGDNNAPQHTKVATRASTTNNHNSPHAKKNITPTWRPDSQKLYRDPQDFPNIGTGPVRVFVVTIQARVTAYTPYDHALTHPEWADGVVAWHPQRRKRHVAAHPYNLATDWTQFPGGSTFIRVPGYMPKSFPKFPEAFRVVDDKCGRARKDRRNGLEPVIDVRYLTRHSAISGRDAWGMKHLNVEVIFPANFTIPASLQKYVISAEWRVYENGDLIESQIIPFR